MTIESGAFSSAITVYPSGPSPGRTAASTLSERSSSSASPRSATSVIATFGRASTTDAVAEVTATFVASGFLLAKPPIRMPARAISSRMPVEIMNALLRNFEPISRSATSQMALVSRTGAGVLTG